MISTSQIILIVAVGAVVLGKKDLPIAARAAGVATGRFIGLLKDYRTAMEVAMQRNNQFSGIRSEIGKGMRELEAVQREITNAGILSNPKNILLSAALNQQQSPPTEQQSQQQLLLNQNQSITTTNNLSSPPPAVISSPLLPPALQSPELLTVKSSTTKSTITTTTTKKPKTGIDALIESYHNNKNM
jgi:Sec-independent protein translocase protein TatA